jgi:hypothetical protein
MVACRLLKICTAHNLKCEKLSNMGIKTSIPNEHATKIYIKQRLGMTHFFI